MTRKAKPTVKFRAWDIVSGAVDQGVERGMLRAYKHEDNPSSEHIAECVKRYVMNELSDVLDWERSG